MAFLLDYDWLFLSASDWLILLVQDGCFRRTLTEWCRKIYNAYKQLADKESKVIFGGRLGEYKYYDMDQVIAAALERCRLEF